VRWLHRFFSSAGRVLVGQNRGRIQQQRAQPGVAALLPLTLATAREQAQARLRHLERRLDGLVYALYGLTAEEIAHVEG